MTSYRWFEDPVAEAGLRFVGYADEVAPRRVPHKGWYIDALQDITCRGVVYQLPAKKGRARYLYGHVAPYRDDGEGKPARLVVDDIIEAVPELGPYGYWYDGAEDAREEAAYMADQEAERVAESEREWREAYDAGYAAREAAHEARRAVTMWTSRVRQLRDALARRWAERGNGGYAVARRCVGLARVSRSIACEAVEVAREMRADAPPAGDPLREAWLDGYGAPLLRLD